MTSPHYVFILSWQKVTMSMMFGAIEHLLELSRYPVLENMHSTDRCCCKATKDFGNLGQQGVSDVTASPNISLELE